MLWSLCHTCMHHRPTQAPLYGRRPGNSHNADLENPACTSSIDATRPQFEDCGFLRMTPCSMVDGYRRFRATCCIRLYWTTCSNTQKTLSCEPQISHSGTSKRLLCCLKCPDLVDLSRCGIAAVGRWCSWLRHCAISWKVPGSIPDGFIGIFHWHNPSGRTVALGLTQPLT